MFSYWTPTIVLIAMIVVWQTSLLFTSVYLHRAMSHRSIYHLHPALSLFMRSWLWLFAGQSMKAWVAVHRKHHDKADEEGDPHSPYLVGTMNLFRNHEKFYMDAATDPVLLAQYTRGIPDHPLDSLLERGLLGLVFGAILFTGTFLIALGWYAGLLAFLAFFFGFGLYLKGGAVVNAFCHMYGYRNFEDNKATNLWWAAFLIAGEGWHNNHHHDLSSPKMTYRWYEFDPAWPFIWSLKKIGLLKTLRTLQEKTAVKPAAKSRLS